MLAEAGGAGRERGAVCGGDVKGKKDSIKIAAKRMQNQTV